MSDNEPIIVTGGPANQERQLTDGLRVMFGVGGLMALLIGVFITLNPLQAATATAIVLAVMIAIYMIVAGVVYLGSAIFSQTMKGWPRIGNIVLGLLYLIAAGILFANLGTTANVLIVFLAVLIGIMWIVEGVVALATLKGSGHPVLTIVFALLSIVAGGVMIFSSALGIAVIAVMIGISLIVLGVVQIVRAFTIKSSSV